MCRDQMLLFPEHLIMEGKRVVIRSTKALGFELWVDQSPKSLNINSVSRSTSTVVFRVCRAGGRGEEERARRDDEERRQVR